MALRYNRCLLAERIALRDAVRVALSSGVFSTSTACVSASAEAAAVARFAPAAVADPAARASGLATGAARVRDRLRLAASCVEDPRVAASPAASSAAHVEGVVRLVAAGRAGAGAALQLTLELREAGAAVPLAVRWRPAGHAAEARLRDAPYVEALRERLCGRRVVASGQLRVEQCCDESGALHKVPLLMLAPTSEFEKTSILFIESNA